MNKKNGHENKDRSQLHIDTLKIRKNRGNDRKPRTTSKYLTDETKSMAKK